MWAAALIFAAASLLGGDFAWPGARATDANELQSPERAPQRRRILERLTLRRDPETRARLAALLVDPDPQVRLSVGRILARLGAPEAIEAATGWTTAVTPTERPLGLQVLRESSGPLPDTARRAIERSLTDREPLVRLLAIDALSKQDARPSLGAIAAASEDESREVRLRAIALLGSSHDARATLPLLARLTDVDRQVRALVVQALARTGDRRAGAALKRQLDDPSDEVRIAAAEALGKLRIADAVPALIALGRRRPADDLARQATRALGDIASPPALAALIDELREPSLVDVTKEALRAAGGPAVPLLIDEAMGGSPAASAAAASLLGQVAAGAGKIDRRITQALITVVERRASAALAAIDALAARQDPDAVAALVRAAGDPAPEIRRASYRALIEIADDRALALAESGLLDRDAQVRGLALRLGAVLVDGAPGFLSGVKDRLSDGDPGVRGQAVATLLGLHRRVSGSLPVLLELLARTPDDPVLADALEATAGREDDAALAAAGGRARGNGRGAIARALAAAHASQPLRDGAAIDLLLATLADGGANAEAAAYALGTARLPAARAAALLRAYAGAEPSVRPRLCAALGGLEGGAGIPWLLRAVDDDHQPIEVRAAAAWAAGRATTAAGDAAAESLRAALLRAAAAADAPLAANARAALAAASGRDQWAAVRLVAPDGVPLARQWVALVAGDGTAVWLETGLDGRAAVRGLPPGPYAVHLADPSLAPRATEIAAQP